MNCMNIVQPGMGGRATVLHWSSSHIMGDPVVGICIMHFIILNIVVYHSCIIV